MSCPTAGAGHSEPVSAHHTITATDTHTVTTASPTGGGDVVVVSIEGHYLCIISKRYSKRYSYDGSKDIIFALSLRYHEDIVFSGFMVKDTEQRHGRYDKDTVLLMSSELTPDLRTIQWPHHVCLQSKCAHSASLSFLGKF